MKTYCIWIATFEEDNFEHWMRRTFGFVLGLLYVMYVSLQKIISLIWMNLRSCVMQKGF